MWRDEVITRSHASKEHRKIAAPVKVTALVSALVLLAAFMMTMRPETPKTVPPKESYAAEKAQYNAAFSMIEAGKYQNALATIVTARETFQRLSEQNPNEVWMEDYFGRLSLWERVVREWQSDRENEALRQKHPEP
jgi:hypothetical protein